MDIRKIVKNELDRRKMSVYRLAKEVGYARPDPIYRWLSGQRGLRLDRLEAILRILNL